MSSNNFYMKIKTDGRNYIFKLDSSDSLIWMDENFVIIPKSNFPRLEKILIKVIGEDLLLQLKQGAISEELLARIRNEIKKAEKKGTKLGKVKTESKLTYSPLFYYCLSNVF